MTELRYAVENITFVNGQMEELPTDGLTIIMGPNNSGKTVLLRELAALCTNPTLTRQPEYWVKSIGLLHQGGADDFVSWLQERGVVIIHDVRDGKDYIAGGSQRENQRVDLQNAKSYWTNRQVQQLSHLLKTEQWTHSRLAHKAGSQLWNVTQQPPSHPVQRMWLDKDLHARFSSMVERAFGIPVSINRYDPSIEIQMGSTSLPDSPPPPSSELIEQYARLPLLKQQGDGIRSFIYLLLETLVDPRPIVVIDEPEAFLHPPQARLLGRFLAEELPSPCQVICATHSSDFLRGVLESGKSEVKLLRVSRQDSEISVTSLPAQAVSDMWKDPFFRYSNVVAGLFHDGVVVCEAEGDCRFYAASLDVMRRGSKELNLDFVHVGGKARIGRAVRKIREFGLPAIAITDIDILDDRKRIEQLVTAAGGDWSQVASDFQAIFDEMGSPGAKITIKEFREQVNKAIGGSSDRNSLTIEQSRDIVELAKSPTRWKELKKSGLAMLTGNRQAANRLLGYLRSIGIFVVPVGELERWVPEVYYKDKNRWLAEVFERELHENPSPELRSFLTDLATYADSVSHSAEAESSS